MSALASSPEFSLSPSSESSEPPPQQSSAPKRKKRQNFSGLTPQQKIVAKKANNRQAAQNLRDRKKQQEVDLERKLQGIEETNARLAAKLAQLEEENRAIQSEALSFANQHIERFQLQGMAQRLMSAVQADPGNGSSISALLAAMGSAMDTSVNISPVPEAAPAPALNLVDPLLDMAASPALSWSPAPLSLDEFDLSPAAALDTSPAPAAAAAAAAAEAGVAMETGDLTVDLDLGQPIGLGVFPDVPPALVQSLLSSPPAVVPDCDAPAAAAAAAATTSTSSLLDAGSLDFSVISPLSFGDTPSPVPALPVLTPNTVRSAFSFRAPEQAQMSDHSAAAGAWPAVPPLPSGLQQLLMVLICTSLMRLPQAPAASGAAAAAATTTSGQPAPRSSPMSSPRSSRRGSSMPAPASCSSYLRCTKEYGLVCSPRSPEMLACVA
eukprot:m.29284 g.29284  ORF g.29284 m.29284 type:complete len:438 (+) comp9149_c0_seq1:132-1445(+)